jgi:amino acid adenylation domain-containing protein
MFGNKDVGEEVAYKIFNYLPLKSLQPCLSVSKKWNEFIRENIWPEDYRPVTKVFEQVAEAYGSRVFIHYGEVKLTYSEVNASANRLANYLLTLNLPAESRVCVYLPHSPSILIAILAILKAGLVYVPLPKTVEISDNRLINCANESQPQVVITTEQLKSTDVIWNINKKKNKEIILMNEQGQFIDCYVSNQNNPNVLVAPNQLAYIIYTSGSSARGPKGVQIEHKGLLNSITANCEAVQLKEDDKILQMAAVAFDAHLMEMFLPFSTGKPASLFMVGRESNGLLNLEKVSQFCEKSEISIVICTPSVLKIFRKEHLLAARAIISVGEHITDEVLQEWAQGRIFINGYGPTEATIGVCLGEYASEISRLNVGRPIKNMNAFITPDNELLLAGYGLARGYLQRSELNQERFKWITHPTKPDKKIRAYYSGDRASLNEDNTIDILFRTDDQIKIHGKMICPGEIEFELNKFKPGIMFWVDVILAESRDSLPKIVAFYRKKPKILFEEESIIKFLINKLTDAMYPSLWAEVNDAEIDHSLSSNAKLDKKKFKELGTLRHFIGDSQIYPRNDIEHEISDLWIKHLSINEQHLPNQDRRLYIDSNFYFLGGTSILKLTMLQALAAKYQIEDLHDLIPQFNEHPTLASLARKIVLLQQARMEKPVSALIRLKHNYLPNTKLPKGVIPLYLIHSLMGDPQVDYNLFVHLYRDDFRLIFGLKSLALFNEFKAQDSIVETASIYLDEIFAVQPFGPYIFFGWSAGGWIAYEMARKAQQLGKEALAIMVDSESPLYFQARKFESFKQKYFVKLFKTSLVESKIGLEFSKIEPFINQLVKSQTKKQQVHILFNNIRKLILSNNPANLEGINFLENIRNLYIAGLSYQVNPCPQNITLIAAENSQSTTNSRLGWPSHFPISITSVPGNHFSVILGDNKNSNKILPIDYPSLVNTLQNSAFPSFMNDQKRLSNNQEEYDLRDYYKIYLPFLNHKEQTNLSNEQLIKKLESLDKFLAENSIDMTSDAGVFLLNQAAWFGNIKMFDHIVETYDIDYEKAMNADGSDSLLIAAWNGHIDLFEHLLNKYNWDLTTRNYHGLDALLHAASNKQIKMFDHLAGKYKWNLNTTSHNGDDALLCSFFHAPSIEFFDHLVNKWKCNVAIRNNIGQNAYDKARKSKNSDLIHHLIKKYDWTNRSPHLSKKKLLKIAKDGDIELFDDFVQKHNYDFTGRQKKLGQDAILKCARNGRQELFDHLVNNYNIKFLDARNKQGDALHHAAFYGQLSLLIHLIDTYDWPLNKINIDGLDLLLHAVSGNQIEIFDYLIEEKKWDKTTCNANGDDALLCAVLKGNTRFFDHLIKKHKWNLRVVNEQQGYDARTLAIREQNSDMLLHLSNKYSWGTADIKKRLVKAILADNVEELDAIVKLHSINFKEKNKKLGQDLVLIAASCGKVEVFDRLAETYKIEYLDARNNNGSDALHLTARYGQLQMFKHLRKKYKWPLTRINHNGLDLLLHAASNGQIKMFDYIHDVYGWDLRTISSEGNDALLLSVYCPKIQFFEHLVTKYKWNILVTNENGQNAMAIANIIENENLKLHLLFHYGEYFNGIVRLHK